MWDRTLTAWGELQDTARPFPTDARIQSELALGAGDLIAYCEGAGRRDLLDQTWQLLATTGAPPISSRRTFHYLQARDSAKMDNAWIWFEKENARFPGHPEIWPLLRDAPFSPYKIY
jgi:hypothetical protein